MNETRQLAEFVAKTGYKDLPRDVIEIGKVYTLDAVSSGIVGADLPWCEMVAGVAKEAGCRGESTVFLHPWRTSPAYAALINGTMIGGFETDHAYGPGSTHPSAAAFPAALGLGEKEHIDGKTLLTAMTLAYEVLCRVGDGATRAVEDRAGFHGPGTNAPFGGAAAAGKVLGLDTKQMMNAFGIAGSHGAGLLEFAHEGAMIKRMHMARGCQTGLESALLANKGFTGPSTVLEGKYGFWKVYSPSPKPELAVEGLGQEWRMKRMMVKPYACHGTQMAVVEGLVKFRKESGIDAKAISKVRVVGPTQMVEKHDDREATTIMGAQYSGPFCAAIALVRDIGNPQIFKSEDVIRDPEVRALAKKVEMVADEKRFGFAAISGRTRSEVTVEMKDGKRYELEFMGFKGAPDSPLTFEDITDKFRRFTVPIIGEKKAAEIIEKVRNLETIGDINELTRLLGSPQ